MPTEEDMAKHGVIYVTALDGTAIPVDEFPSYMDFVQADNKSEDELIGFLEKMLESTNKDIESLENENVRKATTRERHQVKAAQVSRYGDLDIDCQCPNTSPSEQFLYDPDDRIDVVLPDVTVIHAGDGFVPTIRRVRDSYRR